MCSITFAFFAGLSYTKFAYSALKLTATAAGTVTTTVTVTNTGDRDGDEVVQASETTCH